MLARCLLYLLAPLWLAVAGGAHAMTILIGASPQPIELPTYIPFGDLTPELVNGINDAISNDQPLPTPRYQQVYDKNSFPSSPLSVDKIRFFEDGSQPINAAPLGGNSCSDSTPPCGTVTVRIGTTSLPVNGLDPDAADFDANFDVASAVFIQDVLLSSLTAAGVLEFAGSPFVYDPEDGNLLIEVQFGDFATVNDLTQGMNAVFYEATGDAESPVFSLVSNYDGLNNASFGLVTEFDVTIVPEPATGLLLTAGLCVLAWVRRSRASSR